MYDYGPANLYRTKFPEYFAGKWLTYDPAGGRFGALSFQRTDQSFSDPRFAPVEAGELQSFNGVFGDMKWQRPAAAAFGPDGALYVVDSGPVSGPGLDGEARDAGLFRVDHVGDGRLPGAAVTADRDNGPAPLTVSFTGAGSGLPPASRSPTPGTSTVTAPPTRPRRTPRTPTAPQGSSRRVSR